MKRQLNSLFFMAALLLVVGALTGCGSKGEEAKTAETTAKPHEEPQVGGKPYAVKVVRRTHEDNTNSCTTTMECWSYTKDERGPAKIGYCSVNNTNSSGTLTFNVFSGGIMYSTSGPSPIGTALNQLSINDLGLPDNATVDSVSYTYNAAGISSPPLTKLNKCSN